MPAQKSSQLPLRIAHITHFNGASPSGHSSPSKAFASPGANSETSSGTCRRRRFNFLNPGGANQPNKVMFVQNQVVPARLDQPGPLEGLVRASSGHAFESRWCNSYEHDVFTVKSGFFEKQHAARISRQGKGCPGGHALECRWCINTEHGIVLPKSGLPGRSAAIDGSNRQQGAQSRASS